MFEWQGERGRENSCSHWLWCSISLIHSRPESDVRLQDDSFSLQAPIKTIPSIPCSNNNSIWNEKIHNIWMLHTKDPASLDTFESFQIIFHMESHVTHYRHDLCQLIIQLIYCLCCGCYTYALVLYNVRLWIAYCLDTKQFRPNGFLPVSCIILTTVSPAQTGPTRLEETAWDPGSSSAAALTTLWLYIRKVN